MPKTGPILFILAICAACSSTGGRRVEPPEQRRVFQLSSSDPRIMDVIEYAAWYRPALSACDEDPSEGRGECLRCDVAEGLTADEVVQSWLERIGSSSSLAASWLLESLGGNAQDLDDAAPWMELRSEEGGLRLCFARPTPDWRERLWDRALWMPTATSMTSLQLQRPDRGDADLRILTGRALSQAQAASPERPSRRLDGWDIRYALWIDRGARWSSDPVFRRWLSATVDRDAIATLLLDGHARAENSWTAEQLEPTPLPERRAFARDSRPRIGIAVEADDPLGYSIAARLKAQLALHGVELQLMVGVEPQDSIDRPALWLLRHRPTFADPLLALLKTLHPLGEASGDARRRLGWATTLNQSSLRADRAEQLLSEWTSEGSLMPLVSVESWLSTDPAVGRVVVGKFGVVDLGRGRR